MELGKKEPTELEPAETYTIGAAAELLGVSVRTLRHWDDISLLTPQWRTWGGHRLYLPDDLHRAHRILVYREAGMPLQQVAELIDGNKSEKSALIEQRKILSQRIADFRSMLSTIDDLLEAIEMNKPMTPREAADKFGMTWREDWQEEAEQRWSGTEAWAQSQQRQRKFTESDWREQIEGQQKVVDLLAQAINSGAQPDSEFGREISALHRSLISAHFNCDHNRQVLLSRMYLQDARFRATYDQNDEAGNPRIPGATDWLVAAIEADARANGVDPDAATWG